ncbi:transcription termination factor 4, mitochondrial [Rhinatrema bivittatum]|uniref:transcription termination factor 4, mitochondrial n=1 Tax=Rhinatrema bivittatum TaxID=194408 RepID=UPI0011270048|nr:transcription termination factor 4, mitochondrial [Rhinatrema bivittatum]
MRHSLMRVLQCRDLLAFSRLLAIRPSLPFVQQSAVSLLPLCPRLHIQCRFGSTASSDDNEGLAIAVGSLRPNWKLLDHLRLSIAKQSMQIAIEDAELGKAAESLHEMGFTDAQIMQLFKIQPVSFMPVPQQRLAMVSELLLLGLNVGTTLKILEKSPEVLKLTTKMLNDRVQNLRRLGLGEGNLQKVISLCPSILTLPHKRVDATVYFLKERCLFSAQQVTEILRTTPNILHEEHQELEYKFQYAYFRMGIQQQEAVKSGLFQTTLTEIKNRHVFLERLGRYQTPDKKGQTLICNPKLKDVIRVSEDVFLTRTAHASPEEYQVFKKLLAREEEEEGSSDGTSGDEETDSGDEDSDDEP